MSTYCISASHMHSQHKYTQCTYFVLQFKNKMIDLVQWRSTIGCFNSKFKCYIGCNYTNNAFDKGMLHTALNECFHFTVLHVKHMLYRAMNDWYDYAVLYVAVFMILLLCSGNIEPIICFNWKLDCFIGCKYANCNNNNINCLMFLYISQILYIK